MLSLLNPRRHSRAQLHSVGAPLGGEPPFAALAFIFSLLSFGSKLPVHVPRLSRAPFGFPVALTDGGGGTRICTLSHKFLLFLWASHKKLFTAASYKTRGAQWAQERQHQYGNTRYLELSAGTTDTDSCT